MKTKIKIIAIVMMGLSFGIKAQNIFPENGNVGIGTSNPDSKLRIDDTYSILRFDAVNGQFRLRSTRHTGYNSSDLLLSAQKNLILYPDGNGSAYSGGGNVGIGTINPGSWKLAVNGQIRAKEIKVETGWSDFVFYDDYKLPTLKEVESYIKEKGHLKDIPSAKEVEENGIFLGEMNSKLLQKIEELTLYTIQQEKKIKEQAKEINELKSLNVKFLELQKRLEKLEHK